MQQQELDRIKDENLTLVEKIKEMKRDHEAEMQTVAKRNEEKLKRATQISAYFLRFFSLSKQTILCRQLRFRMDQTMDSDILVDGRCITFLKDPVVNKTPARTIATPARTATTPARTATTPLAKLTLRPANFATAPKKQQPTTSSLRVDSIFSAKLNNEEVAEEIGINIMGILQRKMSDVKLFTGPSGGGKSTSFFGIQPTSKGIGEILMQEMIRQLPFVNPNAKLVASVFFFPPGECRNGRPCYQLYPYRRETPPTKEVIDCTENMREEDKMSPLKKELKNYFRFKGIEKLEVRLVFS
jgi:hypothetical protein